MRHVGTATKWRPSDNFPLCAAAVASSHGNEFVCFDVLPARTFAAPQKHGQIVSEPSRKCLLRALPWECTPKGTPALIGHKRGRLARNVLSPFFADPCRLSKKFLAMEN